MALFTVTTSGFGLSLRCPRDVKSDGY